MGVKFAWALVLVVFSSVAGAEDWIQLFNGKDLEGWTPKIAGYELGDNYADTFRVEDGLLKVRYDKYEGPFNERFGHLFYKTPYSKYRIRAEYRFVGDQAQDGPGWATRNSGLMLHGQDPKSMPVAQSFPVCLEVQMLGGLGDGQPRTTGNLCTPGTHVVMEGKLVKDHCISSSSDTFHGDQWVTIEVELLGGESIKHYINGKLVMEYTQPQLDEGDTTAKPLLAAGADKMISGGTISLQAESHPVDFRKVELLPLK